MPFGPQTVLDIKHNKLTCLDLFGTQLSEKNALLLAKLVEKNTSLKELTIEYNGLGPAVGMAFVKVLKVNKTLEQLDVSSNHFGDNATNALIDGLKHNTTLLRLNLKNNTREYINANYVIVADRKKQSIIEQYEDRNKAMRFMKNLNKGQVDQQDLLFWASKVRFGGANYQSHKIPHTIAQILEEMPGLIKKTHSVKEANCYIKSKLQSPSSSWSSFFGQNPRYRSAFLQQLKDNPTLLDEEEIMNEKKALLELSAF